MVIGKLYEYVKERAPAFSSKGFFFAIFFSKKSKLKKADILFLCHDNHRNAFIDQLWYAPLLDTIIDDISPTISHITLSSLFSKLYGSSCYGNVVIYNRVLLKAYLQRLIVNRSVRVKNIETDAVVNTWSLILKIIQPKIIIGINPSPELCLAAKKLNIFVADMQHGILAPGNYYDVRKRSHLQQKGWPDIILCWDEFSKKFVDTYLSPHVRSLVTGHPVLYSVARTRLLNNLKDENFSASDSIELLVTLTSLCPSAHLGDKYFEEIGIPTSLVDYIKKDGSFCNWSLRLHPVQMTKWKESIYKKLATIFENMPNVSWVASSTETLHAALHKCTTHITFNSASARESALLGKSTGILDPEKKNAELYFGDMINDGRISMVSAENSQALTEWINDSHAKQLQTKLSGNTDSVTAGQKNYNSFIGKLNDTIFHNSNIFY